MRDEILGLDVLDELVEFLELDLLVLPRREGARTSGRLHDVFLDEQGRIGTCGKGDRIARTRVDTREHAVCATEIDGGVEGRALDAVDDDAADIASKGADGNAIGGLAVGEPTEKMYEMIEVVNEILPKDKPRYLMGVGTPVNILEGIERGVDMFDCVMPTRNGRNGMLFTKNGIMNMRNKKWEDDYSPIEAEGASYVDTMYSRAYLRHLFHAQELLAMQIASIHNLAFYLWLAGEARKHIIAGDFSTWKPMMVKRLSTRL